MGKSKSSTLVIYHGGCADGHCAAWIARKVYPNAEFRPERHGDPLPDINFFKEKNVLILDYSYSKTFTDQINSVARSLQVLDHHKTAFEILGQRPYFTFDLNRSGAGITCDTLLGRRNWLVDYVEDRDLWNWKLPKSREVSAALDNYEFDFKVWDKLEKRSLTSIQKEGKVLLVRDNKTIKNLAKFAYMVDFEGFKVPVVNSPVLNSELGNYLAEQHPESFAIVWKKIGENKFYYSLRAANSSPVDTSLISKKYKGGGHMKSSAFTLDRLIL